MKYYAVRSGRQPGIYDSWEACREQVLGFPGASYKSFVSRQEALAFCQGLDQGGLSPQEGTAETSFLEIYVDGSFRADTAEYAYGMVVLTEGEAICFKEKFSDPDMAAMRNVAGEIMGARAAMNYALEAGVETLYLYYDYAGIRHWCTGEWKANKEGTRLYRAFYEEIREQLKVEFCKVKGHSHNPYNDLADQLAKEALGID